MKPTTRMNISLTAAALMAAATAVVPLPGIHRSTPNSKRGRQMISPGRDFFPHNMTKEQEIWNAAVEAKKAAKKAAKLQRCIDESTPIPGVPIHQAVRRVSRGGSAG